MNPFPLRTAPWCKGKKQQKRLAPLPTLFFRASFPPLCVAVLGFQQSYVQDTFLQNESFFFKSQYEQLSGNTIIFSCAAKLHD